MIPKTPYVLLIGPKIDGTDHPLTQIYRVSERTKDYLESLDDYHYIGMKTDEIEEYHHKSLMVCES